MPPRLPCSRRSRTPRWSSPVSRHAGGQRGSATFVDRSFTPARLSCSFTEGRDRAVWRLAMRARDSAGRWQGEVAGHDNVGPATFELRAQGMGAPVGQAGAEACERDLERTLAVAIDRVEVRVSR